MASSTFPRTAARILPMRPSSRDGLYALASAWQASSEPQVRPFRRSTSPAPPSAGPADASPDDSPYWPDGPSAA